MNAQGLAPIEARKDLLQAAKDLLKSEDQVIFDLKMADHEPSEVLL